jgi:hypothetical protein
MSSFFHGVSMIKRRSLLAAPAKLLLPRKAEAAYISFAVNGPSDIWMYLDGRLNAPAGTAQYPNLLDRYVPSGSPRRIRPIGGSYLVSDVDRRQPPWMVAGVDYFVGCPTPVGAFPTNKTAVIGPLVVGNLTTDFVNQVAAGGGTIDTRFFPIVQISGATSLVFDGWDLSGLALLWRAHQIVYSGIANSQRRRLLEARVLLLTLQALPLLIVHLMQGVMCWVRSTTSTV